MILVALGVDNIARIGRKDANTIVQGPDSHFSSEAVPGAVLKEIGARIELVGVTDHPDGSITIEHTGGAISCELGSNFNAEIVARLLAQ